jgi:hypothetical protein
MVIAAVGAIAVASIATWSSPAPSAPHPKGEVTVQYFCNGGFREAIQYEDGSVAVFSIPGQECEVVKG